MYRGFLGVIVFASVFMSSIASGQPLGTFRWQLEPHCNIVSVTVTQSGGVYRMEGTDDQCGAGGDLASAIGTAFLNPDGTVGIGLNVVSTPGGAPVHIDAAISVSSLGGTWRDSAGNNGNFVFRTGQSSGGAPRPLGGTIGAVAVNPTQVQLRIGGACPAGTFMQSVGQTGNVNCAAPPNGILSVGAGNGLEVTTQSGAVKVGLPTTPTAALSFGNSHGFSAAGTFGAGNIPVQGPGTRAMWYPAKAAFRAGQVSGDQWDVANVGNHSVAFGLDTIASGFHAIAVGDSTLAGAANSVAFGSHTQATGFESVAMGLRSVAAGNGSVALGTDAVALAAASGTFVFADRSTPNTFTGFVPNQFLVRSAGGAGIYTHPSLTSGVELAPGSSSWSAVSDVNMKENFRDLDDDDVLAKLARMPIREWNYKSQHASIRHIGPTAQDFHAAFGLGEDPLRISTIDADGIALRAIQALEARTRELIDEHAALVRAREAQHTELSELRARLDSLGARER